MSFATDTAVVRVGPGCFTAELHDRWSSLVGIHGGYSAAIVVNAMTAIGASACRTRRPRRTERPIRACSRRLGYVGYRRDGRHAAASTDPSMMRKVQATAVRASC